MSSNVSSTDYHVVPAGHRVTVQWAGSYFRRGARRLRSVSLLHRRPSKPRSEWDHERYKVWGLSHYLGGRIGTYCLNTNVACLDHKSLTIVFRPQPIALTIQILFLLKLLLGSVPKMISPLKGLMPNPGHLILVLVELLERMTLAWCDLVEQFR